ncbi:TPA: hypothetical protein QC364_000798 [Bacillus cereus]|nr:hypothetical protein [Bacillus cereus]
MHSYKNKKGETVIVSQEHLETAVRIKVELQKANGMRCSWSKHRQMMQVEGFDDSENSEAYRQMIKYYQKTIGELPSAPKYAEMVSDDQLQSIKKEIGELAWQKREVQLETRKLGKIKRDIIDDGLFISEVKASIKKELSQVQWEKVMNYSFSPIFDRGETRMILCLTDWHLGALVDVEGNQYDYEIAVQRIHNVVEEAMAIATMRKVTQIDVVYMGDILEHAYMRNSQAYHAEFPVSEQMTRGGRLLIEVLAKLARHWVVSYRGFSGNHDRMNGDKNGNIDGDTGMVVVNDMVKMFIEMANIKNLTYVECKKFSAVIQANGKSLKFVHGDLEKKADASKINDHSSRDGVIYDAIVYGHLHHFMSLEVGIRKYEIRIGSTKGSDDYSEKLGLGSAPSQGVILVTATGEIDAIRIDCEMAKYRQPNDWMEAIGI